MSSKKALTASHTGYRHAKCYANSYSNCSKKISKEHFISENLLRRIHLNDTAKIAGLKWQAPQTFNLIPIKGLASNILCERHNSQLSPLDAAISAFTKTIHDFDHGVSTDRATAAFNGSDVERWALKCLLGMTASGNIKSNLKPECVDILFRRKDWPAGWGLYFQSILPEPIYHTDSLLIETLVDPARQLIIAAKLFIQGLPFVLCLGKPDNPGSFGIWRPSEIVFKLPTSERRLNLAWDGNRSGSAITLTRIGSYSGHPPNWQEWERKG